MKTKNDPKYEKGKTVEWYTPPEIIRLVHLLYHPFRIDWDFASCEEANKIIQAKKYFTIEDNALEQQWKAKRAWLNPPYGKKVAEFTHALIYGIEMGEIEQAILLINSNTCTKYWQQSAKHASAICFPSSRIKFIDEVGIQQTSPRYDNTLFYFGPDVGRFWDLFESIGFVTG